MHIIEITGQPCVGKSTFLQKRNIDCEAISIYEPTFLEKLKNFVYGIKFLGLKRAKNLLSWSFIEDVPFFFHCKIFFNAVSKFGVHKHLSESENHSSSKYMIDEGVSHLPFLFLNTDTNMVINFLSKDLRNLDVHLYCSPGPEIIKERLHQRGHKRLRYITTDLFLEKNNKVEGIILRRYPELCSNLKVF